LLPFFIERFEKENSYLAQAEIIRAIGKCGDKSMIKYLRNVEKMESHRDVLKNAATWAIEQVIKSD